MKAVYGQDRSLSSELAHIPEPFEEGSYLRLIDFLSLNSRLESNKEEEEEVFQNQVRNAVLAFTILGGVPREQKMLKEHLPRAIYHQVYK